MALKDYTLGRGRIHLAELDSGQSPGAFRYIGNTTEFNFTTETEQLTLTNPDEGINEVIQSVQTSITRTGTLTVDDIQNDNLALFLFGETSPLSVSADSGDQTLTLTAPVVADLVSRRDNGEWVPIGVTAANPVGARNLEKLTLAGLTANTDYEVDLKRGMFKFLNTTAVGSLNSTLAVTYKRLADTTDQIVSGTSAKVVSIKFFQNNPKGTNRDYTFPVVNLSPNGDLSLKGDEWQSISFSMDIQTPNADGVSAIYINNVPE